MIELEVGKNFPLAKVKDGAMIDLKEEGFVIFVGLDNVSNEEIFQFRKEKLTLDLSYINDIMFFVLEIGDAIISDIPFHTGLIRPASSVNEVINKNMEGIYPLHLYLVDTTNNILKAMRIIGLSHEFSKTIESVMKKQLEKQFDRNNYNMSLDKIFNTFSTKDIRKLSMIRFESKNKQFK